MLATCRVVLLALEKESKTNSKIRFLFAHFEQYANHNRLFHSDASTGKKILMPPWKLIDTDGYLEKTADYEKTRRLAGLFW